MKVLSPAQHNHILSLLDSGHSGNEISSITGIGTITITILHSRYHSYLHKSIGGCPSKLFTSDIHYAIRLIGTGQVETAVEVPKVLKDITNQPLSAKTVHNSLKDIELIAGGEEKKAISF